MVQQHAINQRMKASTWHVPGRVDTVSKPILMGYVLHPQVGEWWWRKYRKVVPAALGDNYVVCSTTRAA